MVPLVGYALNVKERRGPVRLGFSYAITTPASDTVGYAYTINRHDFNADAWRQLGFRLELESGDGVLDTVPQSQLPASMSLMGSLDGFGVRELTFGKMPGDSPLRTAWFRAPRRVKAAGIRGTLGGYREWDLFDGMLREGTHSVFPSSAFLVAQDASVLNEPLFYTLAAKSFRSRRSVLTDICNRHGVRIGTWTFTDAENVGGYVMKEINEPGDRTVLEFIAEYLIPTTCRAYWRGGALHIKHFTPTATPKRTLTWSDMRSGELRVIPPPTNAPNTVRFAADLYPYVGPDLTGTYVVETMTSAPYTTLVATHKQENTTGVISALSLTGTALGTRVAVRTTTTYVGGNITAQTIETYGAYAPKACNKKQNADGSTRYNEDFDVYLFADGTWRTVQEESWQIVRKTVTTRTFHYLDGWHEFDSTDLYTMHDWYAPVSLYNPAEVPVLNRYLRDDGTGWQTGFEQLIHSLGYRTYGLYDTDSKVLLNRWTESFFPLNAPVYLPHGGAPTATSFKFGPTASPVNAFLVTATAPAYLYRVDRYVTAYTVLTPLSYRAVTTLDMARGSTSNNTYWVQVAELPAATSASDVTVNEPVPLHECTTALMVTQPAVVTTPSLVGAALTGKRLGEFTDSGWCETRGEMEAAALEVLREFGTIKMDVTIDVDFDLAEGDVVTFPYHPDLGNDPVSALIVSNAIDLDAETCRGDQRLECIVWPAEVA